jgi:hypothetical protein
MQPKTIPLRAVQDALMFAIVRITARRSDRYGPFLCRTAAYTQNPTFNHSCKESLRRWGPRMDVPVHFGPMYKGDLPRVLQTVRMHGLPEVRKTFGAGMRALQAEFADGVMR